MANLTTKYMGFNLRNPIIIGSSGLTNTITNLKKMDDNGAGAVVIKSIFEEQIRHETEKLMNDKNDERMKPIQKGVADMMSQRSYDYAETMEYISNFAKEHTLNQYLKFIEEAKKSLSIPVIASINCIYAYDWHYFARKIQDAGADAIELNVYVLPSDIHRTAEENEKIYYQIIEKVREYVTIPIALKISYYFSSLANTLINLSKSGIAGIVLFNRPYSPDIDINKFEITSSNIYSSPAEYSQTLRWVAILSGRLSCDIAASTGIHNYEAVVKQLLAGAHAVQIVSTLYKNGIDRISEIITGLEDWMDANDFKTIEEFRGKLSQSKAENPAVFERVQFMKLYSNIE